MLRLHANVYALPSGVAPGSTLSLRGVELESLVDEAGGPLRFLKTLPVTFEQAQEHLARLPRCDVEPDGFFLLTGHANGEFWRLSGHLNEYEERLHRVELNGECPAGALDSALRVLGWPDADLAFELVREGVSLGEKDFRRYAAAVETTRLSPVSRVVSTAARATNQVSRPSDGYTPWHITFGTYGTRLHGDARPTVDQEHNRYGEPFVARDDTRRVRAEVSMRHSAVGLSEEQRRLIESVLPEICERGGWRLRAAAAQVDRVHVVCDVLCEVHGEKVRRLLKRWLSQKLDERWPREEGARWWAVQGSNKAIKDEAYLRNAVAYVLRQRASS